MKEWLLCRCVSADRVESLEWCKERNPNEDDSMSVVFLTL